MKLLLLLFTLASLISLSYCQLPTQLRVYTYEQRVWSVYNMNLASGGTFGPNKIATEDNINFVSILQSDVVHHKDLMLVSNNSIFYIDTFSLVNQHFHVNYSMSENIQYGTVNNDFYFDTARDMLFTYVVQSNIPNILAVNFNTKQYKFYPVNLGENIKLNSNPVGTYDGSRYFYLYYANATGTEYVLSFDTAEFSQTIYQIDNVQYDRGHIDIFIYQGQLVVCKHSVNNPVNIYISQDGFSSSTVPLKLIYNSRGFPINYNLLFKPFYLSSNGVLTVLNAQDSRVQFDYIDLSNGQTTSNSFKNQLDPTSWYIVSIE